MIKKVIIILLLPIVAEVVIACCDCLDPVKKTYSNEAFIINYLDNSGASPVATTAGSVPKDAFGIRLQFQREIVACHYRMIPTFFQSAYAFSCDCPPDYQIFPKDSVLSIKIFTQYDFDAGHAADSDISDYFSIYHPHSFTSIDKYLKPEIDYDGNSTLVLYRNEDLTTDLDLLLMTAPSTNTTHQFKVQITLSDGRVFEDETTEIDLI
jgi:hypothetical protein